jgi:VanZ family protein
VSISEQEREDAMTIGKLQAENEQNKSNISTLNEKMDSLTKEVNNFKIEIMVEVSKLSTKLGAMIAIAAVLSPLLFGILNHFLFK